MPKLVTPTADLTQVGGVKIEVRTPAKTVPLYAHIPGREGVGPRPIKGISEILLADGRVLHQCDDCFWVHESVRSVVAHRGSGHRREKPLRDYKAKRKSEAATEAANVPPEKSMMDEAVELIDQCDHPVSGRDLARMTGWNLQSAHDALGRAARKGRLVRVDGERGLYTTPEKLVLFQKKSVSQNGTADDLVQASQLLRNVAEVVDKTVQMIRDFPTDYAEIAEKAKRYEELQKFLRQR